MAKEKFEVIKEAQLTNNCPECFNQDLSLTFYQKHTYGSFFHKITGDLSNKLVCNTCHTTIYPVSWTDDIERMFNYYQKTAVPAKKSSQPTLLFYGLLLAMIALVAGAVYLFISGAI
ncbi:MAG: hypothetical protein ABJO28_13370 [Maribacter dokdonensis]|uniref:Uncharacterized protein n=1 Tax=Maribacter dokdonensis TaxID=320912 RepID=A0A1H4K9T1_9FLAO|nr:hypothetical protein [Maribacter dokdonensis]MBU2900933.1 hypothetical protein [Maribacter dokdonensis]SEB54905.1 hypothetical protein SAMN05192540_0814 [Maribacter dokdonensis]|tara:strand:+ start:113 stop:463 length:351 start_codon:yes stop_codon:yes gene_type:complete